MAYYAYEETLKEARKCAVNFDHSRNGLLSTKSDLVKDGRWSKEHIKKLMSEADQRVEDERKQALKKIDKLRERSLIQLDERYSLFGNHVPADLRNIFDIGFKLTPSDYIELIGRYSDNVGALRLITEHANADGFVIRGINDKESEQKALESHFDGLRGFILENDAMKRRYLDSADIESSEVKMLCSVDMRKVEVTRQPKDFVDDWNQALAYEKKITSVDHDKANPFEAEIVGAIFDRDEDRAKKILEMEKAMKTSEAERKSVITDNLTDDMLADLSWMRTFRNQDPDGKITDAEISWLTSKDYKRMYSDRAKQNGKKNDYPDIIAVSKKDSEFDNIAQ